jgi:hypothetical protein
MIPRSMNNYNLVCKARGTELISHNQPIEQGLVIECSEERAGH